VTIGRVTLDRLSVVAMLGFLAYIAAALIA
jgi:hypothetical protein